MEPYRFLLEPFKANRFAKLCGQFYEHLRLLEQRLSTEIRNRGNQFRLNGNPRYTTSAENLLRRLYSEIKGSELSPEPVYLYLYLQESAVEDLANKTMAEANVVLGTKKGVIRPRDLNRQRYVKEILDNDTNFGISINKTYLTVACAAYTLERQQVRRNLLMRTAVKVGEKYGSLPRDPARKINPYLRPSYNGLYEMLDFEYVTKLIERQMIEVAPLAYIHGRTLNSSFIILNKSQNNIVEQMKMSLTHTGLGSTVVITSDVIQVDLPTSTKSGLARMIGVLKEVPSIIFTHFMPEDVLHYPLVQSIVEAYERFEQYDDAATKDVHHDA